MSKLPPIKSSRTPTPKSLNNDRDTLNTSTPNNTTNDPSLYLPNYTQRSPFVYETKLNHLETKLINLEQTNASLLNKINQLESVNHDKFYALESKINISSKTTQKQPNLNVNTDNNKEISQLKLKLEFIENLIQKQTQWKKEERLSDIDQQRKMLTTITEKISETIKLEVSERLKSEMTSQMFNTNLINKYDTEIEALRNDITQMASELRVDIAHTNSECVDRNEKVSRYIDDQIASSSCGNNTSTKNLQNFISKLTEQVKNNLQNQNIQNQQFGERLSKLEIFLPQFKNDTFDFLNKIEQRIVTKLREVKQYAEMNIVKSYNEINQRINSQSENIDKNFVNVQNFLENLLKQMNSTFEETRTSNSTALKSIVEDLESLANRIYQDENAIATLTQANKDLKENVENKISMIAGEVGVELTNQRIVFDISNQIFGEKIEIFRKFLLQTKSDMSVGLNEMNKISEDSYDLLVGRINSIQEIVTSLAEKNDNKINVLKEMEDQIVVRQIMNESLCKIEEKLLIDEINKMKDVQHFLHGNNNDFQRELGDLQEKVNMMKSESTGSISNVEKLLNEKNLREIERDISDVMESMIKNVELDACERRLKGEINTVQNGLNELKNEFDNSNENNKKVEEENSSKSQEIVVKELIKDMIVNVEIENIYSYLSKSKKEEPKPSLNAEELEALNRKILENNETTKKVLVDYANIIDVKIGNAMEKIKKQNIDMWTNSVQMSNKLSNPEEIRKIINSVPPVVIPLSQTMKAILELGFDHENPTAFVPEEMQTKKKIEEERYGNTEMNKPLLGNNKNKNAKK